MTSDRVRNSDFDRAASSSAPSMRIGPAEEDGEGSGISAACVWKAWLRGDLEVGRCRGLETERIWESRLSLSVNFTLAELFVGFIYLHGCTTSDALGTN